MKKMIYTVLVLICSVQTFATAPKLEAKVKKSEKCPQMLKGFENAQKMTLPPEQLSKMKETLQKNGCFK